MITEYQTLTTEWLTSTTCDACLSTATVTVARLEQSITEHNAVERSTTVTTSYIIIQKSADNQSDTNKQSNATAKFNVVSQVLKKREMAAWILVALLVTIISVLLIANGVLLCTFRRQRMAKCVEGDVTNFEMNRNLCYEDAQGNAIHLVEEIYEAI